MERQTSGCHSPALRIVAGTTSRGLRRKLKCGSTSRRTGANTPALHRTGTNLSTEYRPVSMGQYLIQARSA